MTVRDVLHDGISRLNDAHVPSHTLAAELLLMHALGRDRAWIYSHPETAIEPGNAEKYFALTARRAAGEPTQYLIGRQEFWGLEFEVNPSVLIPRPETEHVLEVALKRLSAHPSRAVSHNAADARNIWIADVGTGSGCIAVALASELPNAEILATDISKDALEVARRNAARHSVADRIHFVHTDLLTAFSRPHESRITSPESRLTPHHSPITTRQLLLFDLIVSNPPYVARDDAASLPIEVREHEPATALFGGPAGTEIYNRLIDQAGTLLVPGGILVLELGYNSAPHVRALLETPAWRRVEITNDLAGIPRVISAENC
ncbi:MAG TPA: peptide chain release factor N(5)-glutamine methyltransferase [Candidatus Acidoferrales bacterium]|nr:peptide chain release factor N(5)-glutamine methyltransferase [Candidatus Acidoferrales bacterium]